MVSFPVVYINCQRCYEISSAISQETDKLALIQLERDRHEIRIQVMADARGWNTNEKEMDLDARCMNCDFSKPSVAICLKKTGDIRYFEMQRSPETAHNYRTNAK
ncbi:MAG: hypothetical protein AABW53_01985 [Nanoarchaeota archaeon]